MPHDRNGKLLQKGDKVTLEATVEEIYEQEDACNAVFAVQPPEGIEDVWNAGAMHVTANTRFAIKTEEEVESVKQD